MYRSAHTGPRLLLQQDSDFAPQNLQYLRQRRSQTIRQIFHTAVGPIHILPRRAGTIKAAHKGIRTAKIIRPGNKMWAWRHAPVPQKKAGQLLLKMKILTGLRIIPPPFHIQVKKRSSKLFPAQTSCKALHLLSSARVQENPHPVADLFNEAENVGGQAPCAPP